MALVEGGRVFGLNEVRLLSSIMGASWVDIPVPTLLRFSENSVSGTLRGADQISDVASIVVAIDWGLDLGGFDLEAYAAISGRAVQSNGLAYPNGIRWIDVDGVPTGSPLKSGARRMAWVVTVPSFSCTGVCRVKGQAAALAMVSSPQGPTLALPWPVRLMTTAMG